MTRPLDVRDSPASGRRVEGHPRRGSPRCPGIRDGACSPSYVKTAPESASHRRRALRAIMSKTGRTSVGRAGDDPQDLSRRGLLLQRLGQALLELVTLGGLRLQRLTTTSPVRCDLGLRAFRLRGLRTPTHPPLLHLSAALQSRGDSRQAIRRYPRGQAAGVQRRRTANRITASLRHADEPGQIAGAAALCTAGRAHDAEARGLEAAKDR